ncbi:hypothetical protein [Tabrizicola sp.]|uniref:hypothetical protein n=1 Tax=Tabrizicola sp. TaxID=2005166 RepID=UPI003D26D427
MTRHPKALPAKTSDVPGLAYYTAPFPPPASRPTQPINRPTHNRAAEALEAMYGYYSPQT